MRFDAHTFLSQALPALNFADKGEMNFITGQVLIEPYSYGDVKVTAYTYYGNVSCAVEVEEMPNEPFLVNAQDFMRLLGTINGTVDVAFDGNFMTVKSASSKFMFPIGDADTFPDIISFQKEDNLVWSPTVQEFLDVLALLSPFCKEGYMRPQMSGIMFYDSVAFTCDADNTNIVAKALLGAKAEGFFVVPPSAIKHIEAALKGCNSSDIVFVHRDEQANIAVVCEKGTFNINALTASPYNWHDNYISAWESGEASVFEIDAADLKSVMSQCLLLSPKWVTLTPSDNEIIVTCADDNMGFSKSAECHIPAKIVSISKELPVSFHFSAGRLLQAASKMNGKVTARYSTKNVLVLKDESLSVFIMSVDITRPELIKKP